jgi:hypothetical protein
MRGGFAACARVLHHKADVVGRQFWLFSEIFRSRLPVCDSADVLIVV